MLLPTAMAMKIMVIGYEAPTAANASSPANLPAITLSAMLYICWKMTLTNIGIENFHNTSSGFPTVRSLTIFLSPLFLFNFVTIQYLHSYLISFSCVLHWLILYYR